MIERHWKGVADRNRADEYILHLRNETFKVLEGIEGFISARLLKRNVREGTEFLIVTCWESLQAIEFFAGPDIVKAVVPPLVNDIMMTYDKQVVHYESLAGRVSSG